MTKIEHKAFGVLDRLTTNPWTAFPIFILVVYFLFWCTFSLGTYPMDWIQSGVDLLSAWLNSIIGIGWLRDLVVSGILAGVGGVLVFLPNIIILYLLISVMESTGYMGRVAFIMDKVMHHMGLHGKSFIPMIMGFGCNVPAILACKGIKTYKSRIITVMIIPFLSCSGRLPVYLLLVAAFFPSHGPLILLGIYALGLVLAVFAAKILSLIVPGVSEHDHVEINPYRLPRWNYVLGNTWEQVREYLKKLAGPILIFSVALWMLGYFPRGAETLTPQQQKEQSCIGMIGHAIDPILEPVGMNWKDGIAIVAGVGAKELIVSTLGVMYSDGGDGLQSALVQVHTPAGALAFMIFVLLYFPCIGTFVALRHVTQSWKWTIVSAVNSMLVAWLMAFAAFHIFSPIL
ncbi:MAG: ferrous iron transport protein B [Bacteroidales bacterium]|nr:ferrous iron transport protein B [Candidatus Hennigimonas equi]